MSHKKSKVSSSTKTGSTAAATADIDMTAASSPLSSSSSSAAVARSFTVQDSSPASYVPPAVPSSQIGSYLSQNYNLEAEAKKVPGFICGSCYQLNALKSRESIRCRECGYRIMYKERMRRPMEYSAQ